MAQPMRNSTSARGSPADAEPCGQILFDAFATIAVEQISKQNVKAVLNCIPFSESARTAKAQKDNYEKQETPIARGDIGKFKNHIKAALRSPKTSKSK